MNLKSHNLFGVILLLVAGNAFSQAFYDVSPSRMMYLPTQGDDNHIFTLNPASSKTANRKAAGYAVRQQTQSTYVAPDDSKTSTKTDLTQEGYGAGAMFDLGAGASAGLTIERMFSKSTLEISTVPRVPYEMMATQTVSGRILIDLATGLKAGLALRWINERGDILGSQNANIVSNRIHYSGTLIGHGGGVTYELEKIRIGAAYFPAPRGKAEILYEQRIVTEPGTAIFDGTYSIGKSSIGLGIERALIRRDERAETVLSEDGNRNVDLDGISPIKNFMPSQSIHISGDSEINSQWAFTGGLVQRTKEFVFSDGSVPSGNGDTVSYYDLKVGAKMLTPIELMAGYSIANFSTTLTNKSGSSRAGGTYKGAEKLLFLAVGSKF